LSPGYSHSQKMFDCGGEVGYNRSVAESNPHSPEYEAKVLVRPFLASAPGYEFCV